MSRPTVPRPLPTTNRPLPTKKPAVQQTTSWKPLDKLGVAIADFKANGPYQLSFIVGDLIKVQEETQGWFKGIHLPTNQKGIFPANYIHIKDSNASQDADPVMKELKAVIREWGTLLKAQYLESRIEEYDVMKKRLKTLYEWRRILTSTDIQNNRSVQNDLKQKVLANIEEGRRVMGLDLVVRTATGEPATIENTGIVTLYRLHQEMSLKKMAMATGSQSSLSASGGSGGPAGGPVAAPSAAGGPATATSGAGGAGAGPTASAQSKSPMLQRVNTPQSLSTARRPSESEIRGSNDAAAAAAATAGTAASGGAVRRESRSDSVLSDSKESWRKSVALRKQAIEKMANSSINEKSKAEQFSNNHIVLSIKIFMLTVGEPMEVFFSIYDAAKDEFLTEEYSVSLTAQGMPEDIDKIFNLKTVFSVFSRQELNANLYLVCRVVRFGKMLEGKEGKGNKDKEKDKRLHLFRRPIGMGMLPLTSDSPRGDRTMLISSTETEHTMTILAPTQESSYHSMPESIIKNVNVKPIERAKGIVVGLRLLQGKLETLFEQEGAELKDVPVTNKMGWPEYILPGMSRNDFFITIHSGEFSQDRKRSPKNVSVDMQVVDENGEIVEGAIHIPGRGNLNKYVSYVYYHLNTPTWKETVRINLPPEKYAKCHLRFDLRHCTTNEKRERDPFATAFLKLTNDDGTIIRDGDYNLSTFKHPLSTKTGPESLIYLKDETRPPYRKGEQLVIKARLCSTKFTQEPSVLTLLRWRERDSAAIAKALNDLTFVNQFEVIKFIQEVFTAMFELWEAKASDSTLSLAVYDALVFVVRILVDEKMSSYNHFKPVLDLYLEQHFSNTTAHKYIMSALKQTFALAAESASDSAAKSLAASAAAVGGKKRQLTPTLKALEYIFKFTIASRILSRGGSHEKMSTSGGAEPGSPREGKDDGPLVVDPEFKKEFLGFFSVFSDLLGRSEPSLIGAQTIALKGFLSWFYDLGKLFHRTELAEIACRLLNAIDSSKKQLNIEKLLVIQALVRGELYLQEDSRQVLLNSAVLAHLRQHLGNPAAPADEAALAAEIVMIMVDFLETKLKNRMDAAPLLVLLPELMACLHGNAALDTSRKLDVLTSLLTILHLAKPEQFKTFLEGFENADEANKFIHRLLSLLNDVVTAKKSYAFPENWFVLYTWQFSVVAKVIGVMYTVFEQRLKQAGKAGPFPELGKGTPPTEHRGFQVWMDYFSLIISFVSSRALAIEHLSSSRQTMLNNLFRGDVRVKVFGYLRDLFNALDKYQTAFLDLTSPILSLALLIEQKDVKDAATEVYIGLLTREYNATSAFKRVETLTIDAVDAASARGGDWNPAPFLSKMQARFAQLGTGELAKKGNVFLGDLSNYLNLLANLRTFSDEDDIIAATLKLMEYLKQTDKKEAYVKYVAQLCQTHIQKNDFTEASQTLLLYATQLPWSDETVAAVSLPPTVSTASGLTFPEESASRRKQRLYRAAIDMLDKGKFWERAIELLEELRTQFEKVEYDYVSLADTLQREAALYRQLATVERFFAEYFRVGFYGRGFPPHLRGKEFIYRGYELERMDEFASRLTAKYTQAELLKFTEPPGSDITNGDGQWLQVLPVKPSTPEERDGKPSRLSLAPGGKPLPAMVVKSQANKGVVVFCYSRPFRKTKEKLKNEFKDLWICNYYYTVADVAAFPGLQRRAEVIATNERISSPVENGLNTVIKKNEELTELIDKINQRVADAPGTPAYDSSFTMVLKGAIDAAVNGGPMLFVEAFIRDPEFLKENPDKKPVVDALIKSLRTHLGILEAGLVLHGKICGKEMGGLHEALEVTYKKLQSELLAGVP